MKIKSILFGVCLLFATAAMAQVADTAVIAKSKIPVTHLTFLLDGDQFFYLGMGDKEKVKLEKVETAVIDKLIETATAKNKIERKDFNVIINGDGVMSHKDFDLLLDSLVKHHLNEIRIVVTAF